METRVKFFQPWFSGAFKMAEGDLKLWVKSFRPWSGINLPPEGLLFSSHPNSPQSKTWFQIPRWEGMFMGGKGKGTWRPLSLPSFILRKTKWPYKIWPTDLISQCWEVASEWLGYITHEGDTTVSRSGEKIHWPTGHSMQKFRSGIDFQ